MGQEKSKEAVQQDVWVRYYHRKRIDEEYQSRSELTKREINILLNKLTASSYDLVIKRLITIINSDVAKIKIAAALLFTKSIDEPKFASLYATLCVELSKRLPPPDNKIFYDLQPINFKRALISFCQEEFEREYSPVILPSLVEICARFIISRNIPWKQVDISDSKNDHQVIERILPIELENYLNSRPWMKPATYEKNRIKRMTRNIVFIGELFKRKMLSVRVIHAIINRLLADTVGKEAPRLEDIEVLCKFMGTVGKVMDDSKSSKPVLDSVMNKIKVLEGSPNIPTRVRFMLCDISDLRSRSWSTAH